MTLYKNIRQLVTMKGIAEKKGRHPEEKDLGIIEKGAVAVDDETNKILWVGSNSDIPNEYQSDDAIECDDEVWVPSLVECHTHLVFGGQRHKDYAERCRGKTYQEIAEQGGGILTTMKATRDTPKDEMLERAHEELSKFQKFGIGTIEIKTGYGLTFESELKVLEIVKELKNQSDMRVIGTFLPAHATPPEFKGKTDAYVDLICNEWIPDMANRHLATFFDVFIEKGYFDVAQATKLCKAAEDYKFQIKLHVDQFNDIGGTDFGIEIGAKSLDHLDNVSESNIKKLGESDTVAVLLPGASIFTGTPMPPARKLIDSGAIVALSSDYNPGTCPSRNLPLMTTLACSMMKMTPAEAMAAITYNAAASLGLQNKVGSLEVGKDFRVYQFEGDSYEVIPYCFGELTE